MKEVLQVEEETKAQDASLANEERSYSEAEVEAASDEAYARGAADAAQALAETRERMEKLLLLGVPGERVMPYLALTEHFMGEPDAGGLGEEGRADAAIEKALAMFPLPGKPPAELPRIVLSAPGVESAPGAWLQMTLSERAALFRENPEKARRMAESAGERVGG